MCLLLFHRFVYNLESGGRNKLLSVIVRHRLYYDIGARWARQTIKGRELHLHAVEGSKSCEQSFVNVAEAVSTKNSSESPLFTVHEIRVVYLFYVMKVARYISLSFDLLLTRLPLLLNSKETCSRLDGDKLTAGLFAYIFYTISSLMCQIWDRVIIRQIKPALHIAIYCNLFSV